jgi:hypothetical protein
LEAGKNKKAPQSRGFLRKAAATSFSSSPFSSLELSLLPS